jgi:tetraacyldisaccharide 4'-kinase
VNRIEQHWYRPSCWLSVLLSPLQALFALLSMMRRLAYRQGWLRSFRLPVPVVVIGNINVGGVGKTPLTVALVESLARSGVRVGVISRGYGGSHQTPTEVLPDSDAALVGDEPLLLAAAGAPVVVGRDRVAAGQFLLACHPSVELILTDDGLQHYRLERDLEIAVLDGARGLGNGRLLPNGPLRESASRLRRVDALVVNGVARPGLPLPAAVPCFTMQLEPGLPYLAGAPDITRPAQDFAGLRVVAMAGIGHPERFFATVHQQGIVPWRELSFPDHHRFVPGDLPDEADALLVTSKDAVKMSRINHAKLWVLPVRARLTPDLADWILARLKVSHGR